MKRLAIICVSFVLVGCGENLTQEQTTAIEQTNDPFLKLWGSYQLCKKDTDCIISQGVCNLPVAINKRKKRQFSKKVDAINRITKCAMPPEYDSSKLYAICEVNFCALKGYEAQLGSQSP